MKRLPVFIFFALATLSGASVGASRLHFAAAIGDTRAIESLLAAGAEVNAKAENGITPCTRPPDTAPGMLVQLKR